MVEIIRRVVGHSEPLHHTARTDVSWHCEREYLRKSKSFKTVLQCCPSAFRCVTLAPVFGCQAPADFYAGCKPGLEARNREADKTGKRSYSRNFDCPLS